MNGMQSISKQTNIIYHPIGIVHSPHKERGKAPIQPIYADGFRGYLEIFPEFVEGLEGLEIFSHIFVLFHFHQARSFKLKLTPFFHDTERGIFTTRAPERPNPIGLSLLRLEKVTDNKIYVNDLDILDGTPVLDIKPFTKGLDMRTDSRDGWIGRIDPQEAKIKGRRESKNDK